MHYPTEFKKNASQDALIEGRRAVRDKYNLPKSTLNDWIKKFDWRCSLCNESLRYIQWRYKARVEMVHINYDGDVPSLVGECCLHTVEDLY